MNIRNVKKRCRQGLMYLLIVALVITMTPAMAFADNETEYPDESEQTEEGQVEDEGDNPEEGNILADHIDFEQNEYWIYIPESGSISTPVIAKAYDETGEEVFAEFFYSLGMEYTGVSIDNFTGIVTVTDEADEGIVTINVEYGELTASVNLNLMQQIMFQLAESSLDLERYKFFKMDGYPAKYPISENLFKDKENYAYAPFIPGSDSWYDPLENIEKTISSYGLISFSIQYNQKASIKVYEYKSPPEIEMTQFGIEDGMLYVDINAKPASPVGQVNEDVFLGYIKAYNVTDKGKYAFEQLPLSQEDLGIELARIKDELERGDSETTVIKDIDFYGYTNEPLPDAFRRASLTRAQRVDFVHNILLWDGSVVNEDGSPKTVDWDKDKTYLFVLDTEAVSPIGDDINSYMAFKADPDSNPFELSLLEFGELLEVLWYDPVDMVNGNLIYHRTDIREEGSDVLPFTTLYNSRNAYKDYGLGYGWIHNYLYHVYFGKVTSLVLLPDGKKAYFQFGLDGEWESGEGSNFTFEALGEEGADGFLMTEKNGTKYLFDTDGTILSITEKDGSKITYTYNSDKQLTKIENKSGSLSFSYMGKHITEVKDSSGRTVEYFYDSNDDLVKSINPDPEQNELFYTYNAAHDLLTVKDFVGTVYLDNVYDDNNRVIAQFIEDQGWTYFTWDTENRINSYRAPDGRFTKVYYDGSGRVIAEEDNDGTAYYKYNSANQRISQTDRLGYTTRFEHDEDGNLSKVIYPDGSSTEYSHIEDSQISSIRQADGNVLSFEYDSEGRVIESVDGNGGSRYYAYDSENNLVKITDANMYDTKFTHDPKGNILTSEDALGNVTSFEYDSVGRLIKTTSPLGNETIFVYSVAGKLVQMIDALGNSVTYDINGNGFSEGSVDAMGFITSQAYNAVSNMTSQTDREGNTTSYAFDDNGYRISTTDAAGNIVNYGYDPLGKLISVTDQRGYTTKYSYDANGQMVAAEDPLGNVYGTVFDSMGRAVEEKSPRGGVTKYEYDLMGRVSIITDPEGGITVNGYDANGNLISVKDPEGNTTRYYYDAENRRTKTVDAEGHDWLYEYNAIGQLVKTTTPLGAEKKTVFDADGRNTLSIDPLGFSTEYFYDSLGRMIHQENSDGTSVSFEFDANGRLVSSTNEDDETISYTYNKNGQILTVTDYMGYVTEYTYTVLGQIKTVKDAENGVTEYFYDEAGNLISIKDPMGYFTYYTYDANNRTSSITDPRNGVTGVTYDPNGNVDTVTNADGGVTAYSYDLLNRLTQYVDPEGNVFKTGYDKNGNIVNETDGRGNSKHFVYDKLNRAVEVVNEAGFSSFREYDADGRLVRHINEEDAVTNYVYDKKGQITEITDALGNSTMFEYDSMGRVIKETNARGAETIYTYTPTGRIAVVTDALLGVSNYWYNADGWLIKESNPNGETTLYEYDKLGRVVKKTDPLGNFEIFTYNANSWITSVTDKNGNVTKYIYDANGNVVQTTDAKGTVSKFAYDSMNRLIKVDLNRIDTKNNVNEQQVTLYEYDKNGLLTKQINAVGNSVINVYDENGNLIQATDEDGYVTLYSYEPRNLISAINYDNGNGKEVNYAYNKAGQLVEMVDWNGTTEFTLDLLGQITKSNDHLGKETSFVYDPVGNQTKITYPDNTVAKYEFDLLDRLVKLTDAENQITTYTYDPVRLIGMSYPNGWYETYQHDANGQLLKQVANHPATSVTSKPIEHTYSYDPNGNILTEIRTGAGGQDKFDLVHAYDELNRLITTTGHEAQKVKNEIFTYDSLGNLVADQLHNKTTSYKYNSMNQQVEKLVDGKDLYKNTFDKRGNFIRSVYEKNKNQIYVVEEYVYDATNRMVKGSIAGTNPGSTPGANSDGEQSHYIYNGFGDLVANEWVIAKNAYGYTGVNAAPRERVNGVVVCDRHENNSGQGHINPTGKGHTTGGTDGGVIPVISSQQIVVHKDYTLDFTKTLRNVIMEYEGGAGGLTYRYVYGLEKVDTVIYGIENGAGSVIQSDTGTQAAVNAVKDGNDINITVTGGNVPAVKVVTFAKNTTQTYDVGGYTVEVVYNGSGVKSAKITGSPDSGSVSTGGNSENQIVKLYYHQDRLGSSDYLTDNITGKVTSYVTYDDWGLMTAKAVLKVGVRELDLVQEYTGHPADMVLGIYYAKARMYDADDRRFMAVDPVRGYIGNPQTLAQYTYCLDNGIFYYDLDGQKPYSTRASGTQNNGKFTLYVSPQWLDAGQSTLGAVPVIGWGFTATNWAAQRTIGGFREIDYDINKLLNINIGAAGTLIENSFVRTASKLAGKALTIVEAGQYLNNWLNTHKYMIEESIFNQFKCDIWISDTRDLVDRKFKYAVKCISFLIAQGNLEIKKAVDVFDKSAFYNESVLGMVTYQYDPLSLNYKIFKQDEYYLFLMDDSMNNKISDLEATIKQGVWLD